MKRFTVSGYPSMGIAPAAFLCFLASLLCLFSVEGLAAELPADGTVRISVLSKPLRQLREQSLKNILFSFPDRTRLFHKATGEVTALRQMNIVFGEGRLQIQSDRKPDEPLRRCTIHSPLPRASFTVRIGKEKRIYPLPLHVLESNGKFVFIIEENKNRYALDSAAAELGAVSPDKREALYALALLILSRIDRQPSASSHTAFDFCDLTCCQVYTGRRIENERSFADVRIDSRLLPGPLHFHARCGGRTLGGRVFSLSTETEPGIRDLLTQRGVYLCGQSGYEWETSISARELARIFCNNHQGPDIAQASVAYDINRLIVSVACGTSIETMAPETFRLKLNRVRGWNFLPGNYYDVSRRDFDGQTHFVFKGKGLGHGAGLCQKGALKLASLGYSRYDILRHYFPDIRFAKAANADSLASPDVSYALFSLKTGQIRQTGHEAFIERRIPPGSIFKLIVALYLAARQPSFLDHYTFRCPDNADADMPAACWLPEGHGTVGFEKALSHSCNLYFASLHRHIARDSFFAFFSRLRTSANITAELPVIRTEREYSRLLTGLDHRVYFSIRDLIKLAQIAAPMETGMPDIEAVKRAVAPERKAIISEALIQTMQEGTGASAFRPEACRTLWGKTATVSDGTNRPAHTGVFIGGCDETGIVLVRKNAVGRDAAKSAVAIFSDWSKKDRSSVSMSR